MSSGFTNIDPQVLKFIFNEDLYLVKDKETAYVQAPAVNTAPAPSATKTEEPRPLPPPPVKEAVKEHKKVAVVAGTEKEISLYQEFLSKILQAVGITWEEAAAVAFDKKTESSFEVYLVFGIENQKLVDFKSPIFLNQVQLQGNEKYIFTYSLNDLEKSKDKKKGLWAAMQEAFLTRK